jgi:hypothetical protein
VERTVETIIDDLRDADTAFFKGDYRGAMIRFEAARYLAGDLEDACRQRLRATRPTEGGEKR